MSFKQEFNNFAERCHAASYQAGWWHEPDGSPIKDNKYAVAVKLILCISEAIEAMEGDRKGLMDDKLPHRSMLEVELADLIIRAGDLAAAYDLDVGGAIEEKMSFNVTRPDHQLVNRRAEGGKKY
jgi:NTP pyrophosphatase (non-canonical NTP hydrolase)